MAYRIDFDRSLEKEVRRIAGEQLSEAAGLLEARTDGLHRAVHQARKNIKRTRALYRLISHADKSFASTENDRLGAIARQLSGMRDAATLVECARYLEHEAGPGDLAATISDVRERLDARRDQLTIVDTADRMLAEARSGLGQALAALEDLALPGKREDVARCLKRGWERTGTRASEAVKACVDSASEEPFHDLRKQAQNRWMHAALLRDLWPAAMLSIQSAAKTLVEQLGHEHDLAVLDGHIAESDDAVIKDVQHVMHLAILEQRHKLQIACRVAGEDVFDRKPGRDADNVRRLVLAL